MFTALLEDNLSCLVHKYSLNAGKGSNCIFAAIVSMARILISSGEGEIRVERGGTGERSRRRRNMRGRKRKKKRRRKNGSDKAVEK